MRLLLVEPYLPLARACRRGLDEEGFEVKVVCDESSGTLLALTEPFEVILLDLDPPRHRGLHLLQSWRQAGLATPVLLLVLPDNNASSVPPDLGVHEVLSKPFRLQELLVRLRALAGSKIPERPPSEAAPGPQDGSEGPSVNGQRAGPLPNYINLPHRKK
jgi:two-component system OmpR family response regulator